MELTNEISILKGIGKKTSDYFKKIGVVTVADLINYRPSGYKVYTDWVNIADVDFEGVFAIRARITAPLVKRTTKNQKSVVLCKVADETGDMSIIWFNSAYLCSVLKAGMVFVFYGKIKKDGNTYVMEHPEYFPTNKYRELTKTLYPVYSKTKGLSNKTIVKAISQVIESYPIETLDFFDEKFLNKYSLCDYEYALNNIHFPFSKEAYTKAKERLTFDDFFIFLSMIRLMKDSSRQIDNNFRIKKWSIAESVINKLPFELTDAQKKVFKELVKDFSGDYACHRLVEGDVGSGKTIIAILAMIMMAENGYQSALMVPTYVLATQHYKKIKGLFSNLGLTFNVSILTGHTKAKEKREIYEKLESGEIDIIVGTHALITDKVKMKNLSLVITDEQHRFGVNQRSMLADKGEMVHVLAMTATPIPRTLAMILYADMDISLIDKAPSNRLPVKNCVVDTRFRKKSYELIINEVRAGRQAYVICPLVEESENKDLVNVIDYTKMLEEIFPRDIKVSYLHGAMKDEEKEEIMGRFSRNDIQVLVSTTVIEVGIDVANATVMLIENSERFGLAQLHQIRGRIGRGAHQSYCIFMSPFLHNEKTKERLDIVNKSTDGFEISNKDLDLRGSGDILGTVQSGFLEFNTTDIYENADIIKKVSLAVEDYFGNEEDKERVFKKIEQRFGNIDSLKEKFLSSF
ncbi:ATP-dependent DNA helicase RecG [Acetitomaculum ruminis DSM 5522]|uniref:ATP-dependent DNA helicase RecG n=1 Tax=Acetitomaculum ruminis DSM 5522 TaxID=1120918 RepID=A0A1I0VHQ5_9FIRM|nr:ATP-dependent DNA helicase RecG [Acetitomaculum ruminis]SFA75842.1 ATP-dependent DNA helicase RecG [Acetitomaculum ruminis DSM 5522]